MSDAISETNTTATSGIVATLREKFPQSAEKITPRASADHPAVNVPADAAMAILTYLRDEHGYEMLSDLTAVDWAEGASPRFTVVWHLLSVTINPGVCLRVAADCASDTEPEMPSVAGIWPAANWHERETFDMFGIVFTGHPDLRRILMWDGYPHHPLRKEFPLAGMDDELPDPEVEAETKARLVAAPMAGGPFVASTGNLNLAESEPRAKDQSWSEENPKPENLKA